MGSLYKSTSCLGGNSYLVSGGWWQVPVDVVAVRESWSRHHDYKINTSRWIFFLKIVKLVEKSLYLYISSHFNLVTIRNPAFIILVVFKPNETSNLKWIDYVFFFETGNFKMDRVC